MITDSPQPDPLSTWQSFRIPRNWRAADSIHLLMDCSIGIGRARHAAHSEVQRSDEWSRPIAALESDAPENIPPTLKFKEAADKITPGC